MANNLAEKVKKIGRETKATFGLAQGVGYYFRPTSNEMGKRIHQAIREAGYSSRTGKRGYRNVIYLEE